MGGAYEKVAVVGEYCDCCEYESNNEPELGGLVPRMGERPARAEELGSGLFGCWLEEPV